MPKIWKMTQKFQYMVGEMLPENKDTVLEIQNVQQQVVDVADSKEPMPVVKFKKAQRPLALNSRTLIRQFIDAIGSDDTDDWVGVKVSLYRDKVKAFGKSHNVVRVRSNLPPQGKAQGAKGSNKAKGKTVESLAEYGEVVNELIAEINQLAEFVPDFQEWAEGNGWLPLIDQHPNVLQVIINEIKGAQPEQPALIDGAPAYE